MHVRRFSSHQKGFTLFEIVVAVAVLAIGLLSLAALQTLNLRTDHQAYSWTVANLQASNIIARMRANSEGAAAGYYADRTDVTDPPTCRVCSPFDQATRDIAAWHEANKRLLPAGSGVVKAKGNLWQVTVFWDEARTGATGQACSGDPEMDLQCFILYSAVKRVSTPE